MESIKYEDNNYFCVIGQDGLLLLEYSRQDRSGAIDAFLMAGFGEVEFNLRDRYGMWQESKEKGYRISKIKVLYQYNELEEP